MKNSLFSFKRFKGSFVYAWAGLWQLLKKEQNLWLIFAAAVLIICLAWYLGLSSVEKAILILLCVSVIGAEILNTAVEFISDMFHLDEHLNIKEIKDIMAGFVLIWSIAAIIIGLLIFWHHIFS